nr:quinoprotein amine dehydrogenase, beta chain-like protein [Tanacetum cinerariifolium]
LFKDQVCWELPFMQGWLMGQSQAGTSSSNRAEVISTLLHVSSASNKELLEALLVVIERPEKVKLGHAVLQFSLFVVTKYCPLASSPRSTIAAAFSADGTAGAWRIEAIEDAGG